MKAAIIGAGNMGSAIARGMAKGSIVPATSITVSNPSQGKLDRLKAAFPALQVTRDNRAAAKGADMVILAVKPWLIEPVVKELGIEADTLVVSVAAGISCGQLAGYTGNLGQPVFRLIPNTAISEMQSMTLITGNNTTDEQRKLMLDIFCEMGMALWLPEENGSRHSHDLLRHRLRAKVHPGSHAGRHRAGHLPQRRHAHSSTVPEGSSRADSEQ